VKWQTGTAFIYGRQRKVRWKEVVCLWRVLGWEAPVKAIIAHVEGYKKRFTLVTSAVELTGLQMVELFAARFRQEDGFRDLKQRLGWEECRAWTQNPIERTSQAQWVAMSLLRLLQFRLEAAGEVDWWFRPPWHRDKDRPSVLDAERLMRRHGAEIRRLLSEWLGDEEETTALTANRCECVNRREERLSPAGRPLRSGGNILGGRLWPAAEPSRPGGGVNHTTGDVDPARQRQASSPRARRVSA
jgi:hypothetical protein